VFNEMIGDFRPSFRGGSAAMFAGDAPSLIHRKKSFRGVGISLRLASVDIGERLAGRPLLFDTLG
jgi:hypothetical protein